MTSSLEALGLPWMTPPAALITALYSNSSPFSWEEWTRWEVWEVQGVWGLREREGYCVYCVYVGGSDRYGVVQ